MTERRAKISESLASRGRPEMWANEQESAALSGMTADIFTGKVPALEKLGFPKPSPWNGKRFVPAIIAFWEQAAAGALPSPKEAGKDGVRDEEQQLENFGSGPRRQGIRHAS